MNWEAGLDNHEEGSGTPGYMAPEVMLSRNHGKACDYFALGVIAHECMTGKRPYKGKSKDQIRDKIMAEQAVVTIDAECPWNDYPQEAADFINLCIKTKPSERLKSLTEVKEHPWFEGFDWDSIKEMKMEALYKPENS